MSRLVLKCVHTADETGQNCSVSNILRTTENCLRLSPTQFTPPTRQDKTVLSYRCRRCELGITVTRRRGHQQNRCVFSNWTRQESKFIFTKWKGRLFQRRVLATTNIRSAILVRLLGTPHVATSEIEVVDSQWYSGSRKLAVIGREYSLGTVETDHSAPCKPERRA